MDLLQSLSYLGLFDSYYNRQTCYIFNENKQKVEKEWVVGRCAIENLQMIKDQLGDIQLVADTSYHPGDKVENAQATDLNNQDSYNIVFDQKCIILQFMVQDRRIFGTCLDYFDSIMEQISQKQYQIEIFAIWNDSAIENAISKSQQFDWQYIKKLHLGTNSFNPSLKYNCFVINRGILIWKGCPNDINVLQLAVQSYLSQNQILIQKPLQVGDFMINLNVQTYPSMEHNQLCLSQKQVYFLLVVQQINSNLMGLLKRYKAMKFNNWGIISFEQNELDYQQLYDDSIDLLYVLDQNNQSLYKKLLSFQDTPTFYIIKEGKLYAYNSVWVISPQMVLDELFEIQSNDLVQLSDFDSKIDQLWSKYESIPNQIGSKIHYFLQIITKNFQNNNTQIIMQSKIVGSILQSDYKLLESFLEDAQIQFPFTEAQIQIIQQQALDLTTKTCTFCNGVIATDYFICLFCKPQIQFCYNCVDQHHHYAYILNENSQGINNIIHNSSNIAPNKKPQGDYHSYQHKRVCDICKSQIVGVLYKCAHCGNLCLCSACKEVEIQTHDLSHILIRMIPRCN